MLSRNHRGTLMIVFVSNLLKALSLDLRGSAVTTTQSSVHDPDPLDAGFAVDRNLGTISHTGFDNEDELTNPWWKVDLGAVYCLRKITLVNTLRGGDIVVARLSNNVIRAGMNSYHLRNPEIGRVRENQAQRGAVVDFTPEPYVTARYVSVDIPDSGSQIIVQLAEVMVEEVTIDTMKDATQTALNLAGHPSDQSSTRNDRVITWDSERAVDGSLKYDSSSCSRTDAESNPWWKIDLTSVYCIEKIAIRNIDSLRQRTRLSLQGAIVSAGVSETPTDEDRCGSSVTQYQALINDWIEFTCDQSRLAQFVRINIPGDSKALILCEVKVWPCDLHPAALILTDKPGNQSSTEGRSIAGLALDSLPSEPYCSLTKTQMNPWWRVDLESRHCIQTIRVWTSAQGSNFQDASVRAGLNDNHTRNVACKSSVSQNQRAAYIEFTCNPPVLARYVSVDIPGEASLGLCEVTVATCKLQNDVSRVDFTVVVNPPLLGLTGDNDSVIEVFRDRQDIASNLSFGRQVTTGGVPGLPSGSAEIVDSSLGCTVRLLQLPEEGGLDRTGVFYAEVTKNHVTTRIQTVILPKDVNSVHIRPIQLTLSANIGDRVKLEMREVFPPNREYRWTQNGGEIMESWNNLLSVSIPDVTKDHEGVYSCFSLDQEDEQLHGIMRLIVRECAEGMWNPSSCLKTCRRCYNGGVCDDKSGACVCPPGFSGDNCEQVHGRHVFGKTADQQCSNSPDTHNDACRGRLFCLPDPYGCSCAAGYKGLDCMQDCEEGTFGADCKQTCHCASGGTCRKDTGECSMGCEATYFGSNCQCSIQNGVLGLEVTSGDPHQLFVAWQPDPCASGYDLTTRDECEEIVSEESIREAAYYFVTGLKSLPLSHRVYIRPVYEGDEQGPEVAIPQITEPTRAPTEVNFTSATPYSLSFSWSKPPCGSRGGIITGYTYKLTEVSPESQVVIQSVTSEESVLIEGLTPLTEYSFQVAANTTVGAGPYSEVSEVKTTLEDPWNSSSSVIGGVVAAVLILILLIIVAGVLYKRRTQKTNQPGVVNGDPGRKDVHFVPKRKTPPNSYVNDSVMDVCPQLPPSVKQTPDSSPRLAGASREDVRQPAVDEVDEELPYVELPVVCEEELAEYIQRKDKAGKNGFPMDFKTLPSGVLHPATVASKPENKTKNRYANVLAYDHSRVVLEPLENDPHSDYINACYIDGYQMKDKYIASQGPNKGSLADIWRMVWQYDVDKIIMLTNPVENGKIKCQQYWPNSGFTTFSDITVTLLEEDSFLEYTVRVFELNKVINKKGSRVVKQFHFKTWPDMEPPKYPTTLLNFMRVVNKEHNKGRTVIHCSAGIGRTGTYIALDSMLDQMKQEGRVDVLGFIYRMRQKRNKMVQTPEQYRFVFDGLLASSVIGHTAYDIIDFRKQLTALKGKEKGAEETGLERQYEALSKVMAMQRSRETKTTQAGLRPENVKKNRFPDFPAIDSSRVFLMPRMYANETNYINATFLPGYRRKNMYISTQMPMPNTVADIWRLVYDYKVGCIVMLNPLDLHDETMCRYWPEVEGSVTDFGHLLVELVETKEHNSVTGRTFTLWNKDDSSEEPRTVCQFECLDWPSDEDTPTSLQGMLTLMGLTQQWLDKDTPIVAHCIDGMGRSGVYCALMTLLEQSKQEYVVDVFQAVFRLRVAHQNMMYSTENYALCYEVFQSYLDSNVIYANL